MGTYYVPQGNWTNNSSKYLGDTSIISNYVFDIDVNSGDPAFGCNKNYTATYKCGNDSKIKSVNINAPADGKTVEFNCSEEYNKCRDLKLTLTDDAKLTLSNRDGTKVFWDSVSAFGAIGSIPLSSIIPVNYTENVKSGSPLTVPDYAGNGQPNSRFDVSKGGGPGRRYKQNYLLAGQFLEMGQWIGSPNGTCRLIMGTDEAPHSLQVVKSILGCDSLDKSKSSSLASKNYKDLGCWNDTGNRALSIYTGNVKTAEECKERAIARGSDTFGLQYYGECWIKQRGDNYKKYGASTNTCTALGGGWQNHVYGPSSPDTIDTTAARLYTVPNIHNENIGKVGYVNNLGQLQLYPDGLTAYNDSSDFEKTGNYNISSGAELGAATNSSNVEDCKIKCSTKGDGQQCAGFVFDTTRAMCQLLNNKTFTKNRIIDPRKEYYVRTKYSKGQHSSCPTEVTKKNAVFWNDTVINPTNMTSATKCGLANYVDKESRQIASDLPPIYNDLEYKDAQGNIAPNMKFSDIKGNASLTNANKNTFKYWYENLQNKYSKLKSDLFNTKESTDMTFSELQESKQNLADWTGEQLQNLTAMNEDRDLNMMSQNYRHIMWSILAIIIIIATMKFTKSVASSGAAV